MATKRVRAGQMFYFVPVLLDRVNPPHNVQEGDKVKVVNLPGCPKANTMGHCHVDVIMRANGVCVLDTFGGLVCTNSLLTFDEYTEHLRAKSAEKEQTQ